MSDQTTVELEQSDGIALDTKKTPVLQCQKQQDGSIIFYDQSNTPVYGFEKGDMDVVLPSGKQINIFYDSRVPGQAMYSPAVDGLVFSQATVDQMQHPDKYPLEGWQTPEQKAEYFIKHEYSHIIWDQLDKETKQQIQDLFSSQDISQATRLFAATMVSKPEYMAQEEKDLTVECFEFKVGGQIRRYSKDLVVNELLAHATVGEMMDRDGITAIQRNTPERENFGLRSKSAIDCLETIKKVSPQGFALLQKSKLVSNPDFSKDYPAIKATAVKLAI